MRGTEWLAHGLSGGLGKRPIQIIHSMPVRMRRSNAKFVEGRQAESGTRSR